LHGVFEGVAYDFQWSAHKVGLKCCNIFQCGFHPDCKGKKVKGVIVSIQVIIGKVIKELVDFRMTKVLLVVNREVEGLAYPVACG